MIALCLASCSKSYDKEKARELVDEYNTAGKLTPAQWEDAVGIYCDFIDYSQEYQRKASKDGDSKKMLDEGLKFAKENQPGLSLMLIIAGNMEEIPEASRNKVKDYNKKIFKDQ